METLFISKKLHWNNEPSAIMRSSSEKYQATLLLIIPNPHGFSTKQGFSLLKLKERVTHFQEELSGNKLSIKIKMRMTICSKFQIYFIFPRIAFKFSHNVPV